MPHAKADDGTRIHYRDTGKSKGEVILFLHEYAGDPRSWAPQVKELKKRYRCLVPAARGYMPSDIPEKDTAYGYDIAAEDARAVLDAAKAKKAHVVGLSMGAYTGLMLALRHPGRVKSLVAASGGSGSHPRHNPGFRLEAAALANAMLAAGGIPAGDYAKGPTRLQLKRKDKAAWRRFRDELAEHDVRGAAHVLRSIVGSRPSLYTFEKELAACTTPVLLMIGDEDDPVIEINTWLKRTMAGAGLAVIPKSGHVLNLEDPSGFNARVRAFHKQVAAGDWPMRDMASVGFAGVAPAAKAPAAKRSATRKGASRKSMKNLPTEKKPTARKSAARKR